MSAVTVNAIDGRPLLRPIFNSNTYALRSIESFGMANYDALHAWYATLTREAQAIGEAMPCFRSFVAIQRDIELGVAGLTIETAADLKYAPEREPRFSSWEDRAANDAGVRRFGRAMSAAPPFRTYRVITPDERTECADAAESLETRAEACSPEKDALKAYFLETAALFRRIADAPKKKR
jgi:hypothetical protein